jgi:AhpD family alkylhydroperoxidase
MIGRIDYSQVNPKAINALAGIDKHLASLDPRLRVLIQLRVSQINGCVYCVDLHSLQAREGGESQQRLDCLVAWQECPFFSQAERAALAWAEALTNISETHAPDAAYQALGEFYTEQQIVDLTLVITLMNSWNRLAIGMRRLPDRREMVPSQGGSM